MSATRVPVLALLALLWTAGCTVRVVGDLAEPEANRIVTALERAGIPATKERERSAREVAWAVKVPSAEGPRALEILGRLSLPRPRQEGFTDLVEEDSIVPSAARERLRQSVARAGEIARTLETLEGVIQASVLIAPAQEQTGHGPEGVAATASALLKVDGELGVSQSDVRELVAGAVPGVDPESVTVVIAPAPAVEVQDPVWVSVGPFVVSPASRLPLTTVLSIMALLNIALAAWVVASAIRTRRARRQPRAG
jgi:type III secretion protein J